MTRAGLQHVGDARPLPRRVLILGATGMVGRSWAGLLTSHGVEFDALARPEIDLQQPETIVGAIRPEHTLVINAAAWTDVDGAESDESGATRANGEAVGCIAERCAETGAMLVHYSTDYVFSGDAESPYPIEAPIDPVNAYGRSKAAGEAALRDAGCDHLLVRTSWVYAPWGKNFVRTIAKLALERDELSVVDDQCGRPTSAEGLAGTTLALYLAGASGTWHATDGDACTWHTFAREISGAIGAPCEVKPCTSDAFPRPAKRPAYSVLDLSETERLIGARTEWQVAVRRVLERFG